MAALVESSAPLKILLVTPEAVPFAKTGGLADVASALPRELARLGHEVRLVLPAYRVIDAAEHGFEPWTTLRVPTVSGPIPANVERMHLADGRLEALIVRYEPYFDRIGLYQELGMDYLDNLERFTFFCSAVMELLAVLQASEDWTPHLLHANDWQTALCPVYMRTLYVGHPAVTNLRSLLTVHNLGYQGIFPASEYRKTGLGPGLFTPAGLEFFGSCNLLKGGLVFADLLNTVSPTYSREIQTPEFGFGLEGVIQERQDRWTGVVNGIDTDVWNPATDAHLHARYTADDLSGKRECKRALQREMKLPVRAGPVLGVVSRFSAQKGLDLVADILPELMALDLQVVLLGTGDSSIEGVFRTLQMRYPNKIGLRIGFDEGLAHRIEAGSDMFLMPSRYEPCGLNQQYSLRYGTVPIVRRTGGLADTVVSYSPLAVKGQRATGFLFGEATSDALLTTVLLALRIYRDKPQWRSLMLAGMHSDVSWTRSALAYEALYRRLLE
ncbi:MAG: glycogen synthase GlgA [Nitrospiraceae bacterium]